jgi:rod shape-determining protein MreC
VIRLSIPLRQALSRLTLPLMVAAAFGTMLLGKADTVIAERARTALADVLAPIYAVMAEPLRAVQDTFEEAQSLLHLRTDNARLREENERLRRWHAAALALEAENTMLRRQTNYVPDGTPGFNTARVVADGGGTYARAVLLATLPGQPVRKGQVALDERGLVGRVTEVGGRSARVLLATDMNSRVPITLEGSRVRAMMLGTNGGRPRIAHWPEGSTPQEGERIVTSAEAGAFPAGLPVGVVRFSPSGAAEVELFAQLDRLDMVRLFDFGLRGILPPESVARPEPRPQRR